MKTIKTTAQMILGNPFISKILHKVNLIVLGLGSMNRFTSILYHLIFFFTFSREQHSVLKGRYQYHKNINNKRKSRVELRRNVHRIEKGLLMQPRRDTFAENYIISTLGTFKSAVEQYKKDPNSLDVNELNWAYDVFKKYFKTIKLNTKTKKAKEVFEGIKYLPDSKKEHKDMSPYPRGKHKKPPVDYKSLLDLSMRRRSIRWFEQKPVERELIDKAMLVARQAPTACNRLPYEFKFYDDPKLVKEISGIPFGAGGYNHNIPTLAVIVGKQESYFSPRDRHIVYIDASLAAMSFMYALETLGLASSAINWPDFEPLEIKMQRKLGLSIAERPIMLIAIGYPDPEGEIAYSQKKSLDVLRTYNE